MGWCCDGVVVVLDREKYGGWVAMDCIGGACEPWRLAAAAVDRALDTGRYRAGVYIRTYIHFLCHKKSVLRSLKGLTGNLQQ